MERSFISKASEYLAFGEFVALISMQFHDSRTDFEASFRSHARFCYAKLEELHRQNLFDACSFGGKWPLRLSEARTPEAMFKSRLRGRDHIAHQQSFISMHQLRG